MYSFQFLLFFCPIFLTMANRMALFENSNSHSDRREVRLTLQLNCGANLSSFDNCLTDFNQEGELYRIDKLIPVKNKFEDDLKQCLISAGCSRTAVIKELKSQGLKLQTEDHFVLNGWNISYRIENLESQSRQCGTDLLENRLLGQIETCTAHKMGIHSWKFHANISLDEDPGDPELATPFKTARIHLNSMIENGLKIQSLIRQKPEICGTNETIPERAKSCIESLIGDTELEYAVYHSLKPYNRRKIQLQQARQHCQSTVKFDATCMAKYDQLQENVLACAWETLSKNWPIHFSQYLQCVRQSSNLPLYPTSHMNNNNTINQMVFVEVQNALLRILPSKLRQLKQPPEETDATLQAIQLRFDDGSAGLIVLPIPKLSPKAVTTTTASPYRVGMESGMVEAPRGGAAPSSTAFGPASPMSQSTSDLESDGESDYQMPAENLQPAPRKPDEVFIAEEPLRDMAPQCIRHINALQGVLTWLEDFCANGGDPTGFGFISRKRRSVPENMPHQSANMSQSVRHCFPTTNNRCQCKDVKSPVSGVSYIGTINVEDWIAKKANTKPARYNNAGTDSVEVGNKVLIEFLSAGLLTPIKSLVSSFPVDKLSYWGTVG